MKTWTRLLFCATALTTSAISAPALAAGLDDTVTFNIAPGRLDEALIAYANQADLQVISASTDVRGKQTAGVEGAATPREALAMLLRDSGLSFTPTGASTVTVTQGEQAGGGDSADGTVEALIVTAQKKEEAIQDVPIAISAFTQKALEEQKIEGGFDLLKAIPNVTFSKNNFTSYNFSIRGIGTKAVSATTDPGVSVAFNNTGLIVNRLFEQEYFDIERVEVLRGPQGTLYGRNATAGVINVISAKPDLDEFSGWIKGEVGNYQTKRLSAMVNVPIAEDKLALRLAGALTSREGYDFNTGTGHAVNGRDLWSARLTIGFQPTERLRGNLIWERFEEDDDRSRTGKQLCHRDDGPEFVGSFPTASDSADLVAQAMFPLLFSGGCKPGSLYDDAAFGTPNGLALPFIFSAIAFGADCGDGCSALYPIGHRHVPGRPDRRPAAILEVADPYGGMMQSRDLRVINSFRDPVYRGKADIVQLNVDFDVTENLQLSSQTAYNKDEIYSFQDYNRFNTAPVFIDTSTLFESDTGDEPSFFRPVAPGGIFCDPQLGCSKSIAGFDISQGWAEQFSQELRLQSSFDGPVNFSLGANYTEFDVEIDYYVFFNIITALAMVPPLGNTSDYTKCGAPLPEPPFREMVDWSDPRCETRAAYIDPNPIERIAGDGHNYFRSRNPYKLKSSAAFGELYWNLRENLNLTAGLRYTDDRKTFTEVPSQVLMVKGVGLTNRGYPVTGEIKQHWGEWTGRLALDWKPDLAFTDQTLLYASYAHGYKGGGANPPGIGWNPDFWLTPPRDYPDTFEPEFIDAFETGAKNTLLGGALQFNTTAFFYDYRDYQVSQIKDRTAVNENFDATVWGLEFEAMLAPTRDLRIIANLGYLDTEIAEGELSLDVADRTASNPNYVLMKPFPFLPSNCVIPLSVAENFATKNQGALQGFEGGHYWGFCMPNVFGGPPDPNFEFQPYNPANYPELNNGAGLFKDVGGNELPNSPHWTVNLGAQYSADFVDGWRATVRGDAYWQSQSWARVYNAVNDKLHGWYNVNLSLWLEREDGLKIEIYAKNLLDKTPITDAFINSDDTGLTTNVFVLDPRLIGLSIRKEF